MMRLAINSMRVLAAYARRPFSAEALESQHPSKERLLFVDHVLSASLPSLLKGGVRPVFELLADDVVFEDHIFGYHLHSRAQFVRHLAKLRIYFHYKSPCCRLESRGSFIYDDDDAVVLLWRLSVVRSSLWNYLPFRLRQPPIETHDGALCVRVTSGGLVYLIENRPVYASDLEAAKLMKELKKAQEERRSSPRSPLRSYLSK